jgi:thiosulfate dehydrogenase [quinone] large subunit
MFPMATLAATRDPSGHILIDDPPIAQALFNSTRLAWLWLPLRLWLGYEWLEASSHKIMNPDWMVTGVAIRGFWERAVAVNPATGNDLVTYDWYQAFINLLLNTHSEVWFGKLIAVGELAIGLGLIVGAFVGIAAFFGGLMSWSFLMAGTISTNPLMFAVTGLLILAWKVAGFYGLDRYLLPLVGTPWQRRAPGAPKKASTPGELATAPVSL